MQNVAVALGKYGIRANAVLPGTIATDINKEDLQNTEKREYMVNRTLLGRLGGDCLHDVHVVQRLNFFYST